MKISSASALRFVEMVKATWHILVAIVVFTIYATLFYAKLDAHLTELDHQGQYFVRHMREEDKVLRWVEKQAPGYKDGDAPDIPDLDEQQFEPKHRQTWYQTFPNLAEQLNSHVDAEMPVGFESH